MYFFIFMLQLCDLGWPELTSTASTSQMLEPNGMRHHTVPQQIVTSTYNLISAKNNQDTAKWLLLSGLCPVNILCPSDNVTTNFMSLLHNNMHFTLNILSNANNTGKNQ